MGIKSNHSPNYINQQVKKTIYNLSHRARLYHRPKHQETERPMCWLLPLISKPEAYKKRPPLIRDQRVKQPLHNWRIHDYLLCSKPPHLIRLPLLETCYYNVGRTSPCYSSLDAQRKYSVRRYVWFSSASPSLFLFCFLSAAFYTFPFFFSQIRTLKKKMHVISKMPLEHITTLSTTKNPI